MTMVEQREGIGAGRLDMFVDGAFAFTLTLLAIGGETIPDSGEKLLHLLRGVPAAACCFAQIALFWHAHVRWRQLCPRNTTQGLLLSLLLVFLALIFVYPLHMVYASAFSGFSGGLLSPEFQLRGWNDVEAVYICFGLSFASMAGVLVLLFRHARRQSANAQARIDARVEMVTWAVPVVTGLLSSAVAVAMPAGVSGLATAVPGLIYCLMFLTGPLAARSRRLLAG